MICVAGLGEPVVAALAECSRLRVLQLKTAKDLCENPGVMVATRERDDFYNSKKDQLPNGDGRREKKYVI